MDKKIKAKKVEKNTTKETPKQDLAQKILNNVEKNLTQQQKEEAIKKEEHYRKLYGQIYDFNQTRDFAVLCNSLISGYENMLKIYEDESKDKKDIDFIIKFAFRDFYLLMFINLKSVFDNDQFLKDLHKKVYFSDNYVNIDDFRKLIDYCRKFVKNDKK